jgi:hypothetical protein
MTQEELQEAMWERRYPTTVKTVDGRVLNPNTDEPVDCELMAPFEDRVPDIGKPAAAFRFGWWEKSRIEIAGAWYHFFITPSFHQGHIRQGIAMSRACRALQSKP